MALAKIDLHFNVKGGGLLYLTTLFVAKIIHVIGGSQMKYEYVALME